MRAVVGISERTLNHVCGVTSFSKTLIRSPNSVNEGEDGNLSEQQRHVAVWAANNEGMTPGSLMSANLTKLERVDEDNLNSRYKPKFFDLTIALAKESKADKHVAIPIGVAKLKISGDFVKHGEFVTMDLPVHTLEQSRELNRMNGSELQMDEKANGIEYIELKTKRKGIKKLFPRQIPTVEERAAFSSAYNIDPSGDAMIRVQVRVETLGTEKIKESSKAPKRVGTQEDDCDKTASTDPLENDDSIRSSNDSNHDETINTAKLIMSSTGCKPFEVFESPIEIKVETRNTKTSTEGTSEPTQESTESSSLMMQSNSMGLYARPVESKAGDESDAFQTVPPLVESTINETESPSLKIFGQTVKLPTCTDLKDKSISAQKLDDEIEQVAQKLFGQDISFSNNASTQSQREVDGNSLHASSSKSDKKSINASPIVDMSVIGPLPTVEEVQAFIKEQFGIYALKSGEFFFPEDPNLLNDDSTSVGSATLEAFATGQLRIRTMDSSPTWTRSRRGDDYDDDDDDDTIASYDNSEPTINLIQPFGENSSKSESEKKDPPMTAVTEEERKEDVQEGVAGGDEKNKFTYSTKQKSMESGDSIIADEDDERNHDGDDEMTFHTPPKHGGKNTSGAYRSLAESFADAFTFTKGCGSFTMDPRKTQRPVPKTVQPVDSLSVGDLTATTLENQSAAKRSSIPTKMLSQFQQVLGRGGEALFMCTGTSDNVEVASTPIRFTTSDSDLGVTRSNSVLSEHNNNNDDDDDGSLNEDYFAEYEESGLPEVWTVDQEAKREVGGNATNPSRAKPTKDPPAIRLTDDDSATLASRLASDLQLQEELENGADETINDNVKDSKTDVDKINKYNQDSQQEFEYEEEEKADDDDKNEC
jgi:hypothetical protein